MGNRVLGACVRLLEGDTVGRDVVGKVDGAGSRVCVGDFEGVSVGAVVGCGVGTAHPHASESHLDQNREYFAILIIPNKHFRLTKQTGTAHNAGHYACLAAGDDRSPRFV